MHLAILSARDKVATTSRCETAKRESYQKWEEVQDELEVFEIWQKWQDFGGLI